MNSFLSQLLVSLAWLIPGLTVCSVGIVAALARWHRHPPVSALLVGGLATQGLVAIAIRIAFAFISELNRGVSMEAVAWYVGALQLVWAIIRTICWAAFLAAVFGWRQDANGHSPPLQFSIRSLIVVTVLVAVACGIGRAAVGLFGELPDAFVQFVDDIPVLACLSIGIWIAIARWSRHPTVSQLAVVGFSLALATNVIGQLMFLAAQWWFVVPWLTTWINFGWIVMGAASWAIVIYAALEWRTADHSVSISRPERFR